MSEAWNVSLFICCSYVQTQSISDSGAFSIQSRPCQFSLFPAIFYLLYTEARYNFQTIVTERVHVNGTSSRGLEVDFDITLPNIPCNLLSIDANDPTGQPQSLHLDKSHHVWKHRVKVDEVTGGLEFRGRRTKLEPGSTFLDEEQLKAALQNIDIKFKDEDESSEEDECGSCYGAGEEDECCNNCEDVKRAYQKKGWQLKDIKNVKQCQHELKKGNEDGEGCNVHGLVALDSGGGSFHLAPSREMSDALSEKGDAKDMAEWFNNMIHRAFEDWNVTHTIHKIRFGDSYPGHVHQLDGKTRAITDGHGMYQYYFKVRQEVVAKMLWLNHEAELTHILFSDCSDAICLLERYNHSNESIQCDRAFAPRESRKQPRFAGSVLFLRSLALTCGNCRRLSEGMGGLFHVCLCDYRRSGHNNGNVGSILAFSKRWIKLKRTGSVVVSIQISIVNFATSQT